MVEWVVGWVNVWLDAWMDRWMDEQVGGLTDGEIGRWTIGGTDGEQNRALGYQFTGVCHPLRVFCLEEEPSSLT